MPRGVFEPSEKKTKSWGFTDLKLSKCMDTLKYLRSGGGIVGAGSWLECIPSTSARSMLCCSREFRIFVAGGVEDVSS